MTPITPRRSFRDGRGIAGAFHSLHDTDFVYHSAITRKRHDRFPRGVNNRFRKIRGSCNHEPNGLIAGSSIETQSETIDRLLASLFLSDEQRSRILAEISNRPALSFAIDDVAATSQPRIIARATRHFTNVFNSRYQSACLPKFRAR